MMDVVALVAGIAVMFLLAMIGSASMNGAGGITVYERPECPRPAPPKGQGGEVWVNESGGHGDFPPGFEVEMQGEEMSEEKNIETKEEKEERLNRLLQKIREFKFDMKTKRALFLNMGGRTKFGCAGEYYISPGNAYFNKIDSLLSEMVGDICLELGAGKYVPGGENGR